MMGGRKTLLSLAAAAALLLSAGAPAKAQNIVWDGSEPAPGIYFYWYEPSFYAGFAPRTQDPSRVHIELSRGNQVRLTIVLGPEQIDAYLDDLIRRQATYQELADKQVIRLTTNRNYGRFAERLSEQAVAKLAGERASLGEAAYREKSVEVMSRLNPGRIFRIRMPVDGLIQNWHALLAGLGAADLEAVEVRLDAANAILPGRLNLYELSPEIEASLGKAAELARAGGADSAPFRDQALAFLAEASKGHYPVRDGHVEAIEFTAIYPAGTADDRIKYKDVRLPNFGVTGIWPLMPRDQGRGITGMVDYLSTNPGYGFISMLAYQYAGGVAYNAFHNAGIRTPVGTHYLPPEWRSVAGELDPKKPYQQLWIISRGPASHGCTRLDSGQMSEMRNALPSASEAMAGIPNFRNRPQCFDVFDIDGDGRAEVMGVQYYLAYQSKGHKPVRARAPNQREPFYAWLYGDNIAYNADGSAVIKEVPICRFIGLKKAVEAETLKDVPLYEAAFETGPIQFYQIRKVSFETRPGFEFNRELRKVGVGHDLDRAALFLE